MSIQLRIHIHAEHKVVSSYTKYDFFFIYRWNMKIIPEEDELLLIINHNINYYVVIAKCDDLMFIG